MLGSIFGEKERGKSKSTHNGLRKSTRNIGNPYQIEDNKTQGGGAKRRPLGAPPKVPLCCLRFGKDFVCFGMISGAHSGSILIFPPSFFWERLFPLLFFSHYNLSNRSIDGIETLRNRSNRSRAAMMIVGICWDSSTETCKR